MSSRTATALEDLCSLRTTPVLSSESPAEFERVREAFFRKPVDFIERMYSQEFIELYWEARRFRHAKAALIDSMRTLALKDVLVLGKGEMYGGTHAEEQALAVRSQHDPVAQEVVSERLARQGLSASAIDAQAVSLRLEGLEKLERMIGSIESRRDKALLKISDYRQYLAVSLRQAETRLIEADAASHERQDPKISLEAAE